MIVGEAYFVHVILTKRTDTGLFEEFADFIEA